MAVAENVSMDAMWDGGMGRQLSEVTSSSSETTFNFWYRDMSIFSLLWSENTSQELATVTLHPPRSPRGRGDQSLCQWFIFFKVIVCDKGNKLICQSSLGVQRPWLLWWSHFLKQSRKKSPFVHQEKKQKHDWFTQLLLFRVRRMLKRSHRASGISVVGGRKTIRTTYRSKNTYNHQFSPSPINTTLLQQSKLQLLW